MPIILDVMCSAWNHRFPFPFVVAVEVRYQAKADRQVGQGEERRPSPYRTMDAVFPVPRKRQYLEPRNSNAGQDVRSMRRPSPYSKICSAQKLGGHRIGRYADQGVQLQHSGAGAFVRGAQRLCQMYRCSSDPAVHINQQR